MLIGKVTFNGKPLKVGQVIARNYDATRQAFGEIDQEGNYRIAKAPAGKVKVYLDFPVLPGPKIPPGPDGKIPKLPMGIDTIELPPDVTPERADAIRFSMQVPSKYKDSGKTVFDSMIKEGQETKLDLKLTR